MATHIISECDRFMSLRQVIWGTVFKLNCFSILNSGTFGRLGLAIVPWHRRPPLMITGAPGPLEIS